MEQKKWNRNDRRPPLRRAQEPSEAAENMLEGRNAVQEALAAGRPIDKLDIAAGETDRALARLAAMAKEFDEDMPSSALPALPVTVTVHRLPS